MAGTQFSGIKYSRSNLFEGAPMVIVPPKYDDILLLEKIKKLTGQKAEQAQEIQDLPDEYFKVLEIVGKYFENNISLKRSGSGKGTMTIHFGSDEEVGRFLKALEDAKI